MYYSKCFSVENSIEFELTYVVFEINVTIKKKERKKERKKKEY